ncbi:MAG: iron-containing alcohol dehydrogenase [Chlorobi bacterium]|nr:iron-containing alcohol dehydrogenase [Chlorobiota bacterium]
MENFIYNNPAVLHFGNNISGEIGQTVKKYGDKTLLVYGTGSVKKNGIYDIIVSELNKNSIEFVEYSGIKPNPVIEDVYKMIELGQKENVNSILAVGGGSVIDSSKVVSISLLEDLDPWMVVKGKLKPTVSLPLVTVLTLAATGTEMNAAAVVQNKKTGEKIGFVNPLSYPKHSFLNPEFTFSVPENYTAFGIVDQIAHALEAWFANGDSTLADRFIASIIIESMELAPKVFAEPRNYEYRSKIMLAATCALNGITSLGRKYSGDWGVHDIGHTLSFLYDTPHGASLSIAYPAWLKLQKSRIPDRIKKLGEFIFNEPDIEKFISKLEDFFHSVQSPIRLSEIQIEENELNNIEKLMNKNSVNGLVHKLGSNDYNELINLMK